MRIFYFSFSFFSFSEPANFDTNKLQPWNWPHPEPWNIHCPLDEPLESPRYKTAIQGDYLSDKTLCMIAEQTDGQGKIFKHYDVHNLYGWSETLATLPATRATENKRSIVISRSTFPTSGSYAGHWLGDNTAAWAHIKYNIIGMLEFNLFGIPYVGADICGFEGNTTEEMCQRWMQLGAFNPFFRNHNGIRFADQDPGSFSAPIVDSNRRVVETRYTLIPYLYTLFHRVHISGGTVVRSMAHEFPTDSSCWPLDEQFLWGSNLLIAPVVYEGHRTKDVYLPSTERWFNYYTGEEITKYGLITEQAPRDHLPLYLRGGSIIPHQQSAMNTVLSRKKPFYLYIALSKEQKANGDLYWDDGESINTYETFNYNYFIFNYDSQRLTIEPLTYKYPDMKNQLEDILIFGMTKSPTSINLNREDLSKDKWAFYTNTKVLNMTTLNLDLSKSHEFFFL
jgi:alpha-glucosidase (family GH31 glycosyl hydrolase)